MNSTIAYRRGRGSTSQILGMSDKRDLVHDPLRGAREVNLSLPLFVCSCWLVSVGGSSAFFYSDRFKEQISEV